MEEEKSRTAVEVILDLESKIDLLLSYYKSQDLNLKILSNKVNSVIETLKLNVAQPVNVSNPIKIESIDINNIPIIKVQETAIIKPIVQNDSSRRTGRPETLPKVRDSLPEDDNFAVAVISSEEEKFPPGTVIVTQRLVTADNKGIFLADMEIHNLSEEKPVIKTRSNATGKWKVALNPGKYRINMRKGASLSKKKLEGTQEIIVNLNGSNILELPNFVLK